MNRNAEHCQRCIDAISAPPMTDEEIAAYESDKAAVRARDEAVVDLFEGVK